MKKLAIISISILLFSSSCSSTKNSWDCPILNGSTTNCSPIKESDSISNNIDNKKVGFDLFSNSTQKIEINLIAPKFNDLKKLQKNELPKIENSDSNPKLRTKEKVGKIWFAPYIDSDGNQHSEKTIYVVDEEAKWVGQR